MLQSGFWVSDKMVCDIFYIRTQDSTTESMYERSTILEKHERTKSKYRPKI